MALLNEQTRQARVERLRPYLKDLSAQKEPKTNKAVLLVLIQDLKDEGNQLFKEGQFAKACSHYTHGIFVARVLEDRFYHEVGTEFMGTLYSNGSLSHLKLNNFEEALSFATTALELQPENVKAKYRKVQALHSLKRNREALAEAQEGMKTQPVVFRDFVSKLEEAVEEQKGSKIKSATASATEPVVTENTNASNEWLAGTNALKTEKQRQAVLDKMPKTKKKKGKVQQPVVTSAKDSSDSEVDSDSSDPSEEDGSSASNNSSTLQKEKNSGGQQPAKKSNIVRVKPSEPDPNTDVLAQRTGFTKVGAAASKSQSNGMMGLDTFHVEKKGGAKSKGQAQSVPAAPRLPPVNINWPLQDSFVFRLACKTCFIKTGEGYKGYNYFPNGNHRCEKNVLIVRQKDNESLNWMKIRRFPELMNNSFSDFKMCQQFRSGQPCKIGEMRCTFPHNKVEMHLWYMERDGDFSYTHFMEGLQRHDIDSSEQLEARKSQEKPEPPHIPGLNFKTGARPRLSSPAPVAQTVCTAAPVNQPDQSTARPARPPLSGTPPSAADRSSAALSSNGVISSPRSEVNGLLGNAPSSMTGGSMMPKASSLPSASQFPTSAQRSMGSIDNSLKDFDYRIVCPQCFIFENFPGKYRYMPCTHECEENVLAVKQRGVPSARWMRVRERTNHRDFNGNYVMCHSIIESDPSLCRFGEFQCSFAHNEAEQQIWGLEKSGRFSITDFILQNRHSVTSRGYTVDEVLKKYGGFFTYVCRNCFYGRPPRISVASPNNCCSGTIMRHQWDISCILAHVNTKTSEVTLIEHRKFTNKGAFFRICKYLQYCPNLTTGTCLSAHSLLERDVWMLERDSDISRPELVRISQMKTPPAQPPGRDSQQNRTGAGPTSLPQVQSQLAPPTADADSFRSPVDKVPYPVQEYCGLCWTNGTKSLQQGTTNRCVKGHSNFNIKRVFLIGGIFRELRNLPAVIPRNLNFMVCRYIQQKKKCQYVGQGPCQFAHSEEERVLWIWMARNKIHKPEDVVKQYLEDQKRSKISQGDSVVAATTVRAPVPVRMPSNLQNNAHYCRYCSVQSNSERQWEDHCASEKHIFNVNSDKDHQWNFRQPPWGQGNNLNICSKHMNGGRCPYSHVPDMFNLCMYAHSQEELDEWHERYEWRQMKRSLAKEQNMFSYMDKLLEQYNSADSRVTEMAESVDGVQVTCSQPLAEFRKEKNASLVWSFILRTQLNMERVALLHHSARLHFHLQGPSGSKLQIASGEQFEDVDSSGRPCYKVVVAFTGGMFGSFSQWVVFDFGKKPVLLKKINVELGQETVHEKVKDLRQKLAFDRWTSENRQVIPYQYKYDDFTVSLTQHYKEPSSEVVVTQDSIRELNRHNYMHKMHKMLELEEMTRQKLISSFNVVDAAEVKNEIVTEQHGTYGSRQGELFLHLPLTENLTEDTGAGKLILTGVRSALLTCTDASDKGRVYEALIESRGRDYVVLCLSPVCVRELKLQAGTKVEVEAQFQLNRMHFMNMHYALDALADTDIVFPDVTKINPMLNEQHTLRVSSRTLNQDQLQAVRHIVAERTGYTPPFVMYGPFGTGKTETLAQAAMVLLREKQDARILICAQSNSSADLYVVKHLDPYLRKSSGSQGLLLRIVSRDRRVHSIPEGSRKYCCYSSDGSSFEIPSASMVRQHRVVVTTLEMALHLTSMKLRGTFTHIFIDEAAQALECETIMPLTLAAEKTCVVLTGDHLQISPKVYSAEARRQNFGMSMLERLYQYYYEFYSQERVQSNRLNIFLSINYRTKMEILRFISAVFYGGPDKLTAGGCIPSVLELTPLQFYAVQGQEVQDAHSTSFYNRAESSEVVERVVSLLDNWPQEWGRVAPEEIGVVTPYHEQVKQIRLFLKSFRRPDLRLVNVETVQNIQGKEFRALFISTVRTRNLLLSEHVAKALKQAEAVGDVADFVFLSDRKLLNTAMTRTMSMVAVVGDPVALCGIGECIQIWRTFLKHCHNMRSIRPVNINYDNIKSEVVQLQMSNVGHRIKEVTELVKNPSPPLSDSPDIHSNQSKHPNKVFVNRVDDSGDNLPQKEVYVDDMELPYGAGDGSVPSFGPSLAGGLPASFVPTFAATNAPAYVPTSVAPPHSFAPGSVAAPTFVPRSVTASTPSFAPPPGAGAVPPPFAQRSVAASVSPFAQHSVAAPARPFAPTHTVTPTAAPGPGLVPAAAAAPAAAPAPAFAAPKPFAVPSIRPTLGLMPPMPLKPLSKMKTAAPVPEEFKMSDFPIQADAILLQLAIESFGGGHLMQPLKAECVSVLEEEGQAVLKYSPQLVDEDKRRKLLQAASAGNEFDGDAEIYEDIDEDSGIVTRYYNYTEQTLQSVLHNQPDRYKCCSVHAKGDNFLAKVLDPLDPVQEVEVSGSLRRGRAFDQDEAVVEILPEFENRKESSEAVQGRIVGILQRSIDHRYRSFVCSAESFSTGLLKPINPGIPSIYNVVLPKHVQQVKKNFVCVYRLSKDKTLSFSHYEKVEAGGGVSKLFVVRYLKWLPAFFNPLGVVIGVLPLGQDLPFARKVIDIEHQLPIQFSDRVMEELQSGLHDDKLPQEVYSTRTNLTHVWSFTISPPHINDLEVAFSIDQVSDTSYQVCVHVSDVAYFVEQGSELDKEALQRGVSILPIGREAVPMLPGRLCWELCSLQPGKDRCAQSIFMTVAGSGDEWHVVDTAIHHTVINSKHRFSLDDVESVLQDIEGAEQDYLKSCVLVLFQIAVMWRKQHKGSAYLDPEQSPLEMLASRANHMVQELLIMANYHAAQQLLKVFPNSTPLLQQSSPNMQKLEAWKSKHAADAINSVSLTKPFLEGNKVCTCSQVCMCVYGYMRDHEVKPVDHFDVLTSLWQEAMAAVPMGLVPIVQKMVASSNLHPQSSIALQELHSILPQQQLVIDGEVDPSQQGHYSLNLSCVTDLTSPLRSYFSLLVQRLMTALITDQPCPYNQPDLARLVATCNHSHQRANRFAAADAQVHLAAALQSRPLTLLPVVSKLDRNSMTLHFANVPHIPERERHVDLPSLGPSELPLMPDKEQVRLTWQKRVYDSGPSSSSAPRSRQHDTVELCADRFVSHVPHFQWQKLLTAIREDDEENQLTVLMAANEHVHSSLLDGLYVEDVSSETCESTEFSLSPHTSMVLQVQVSGQLIQGLLTPRLQLVSLTPTLDVCVEHQNSPTRCFSKTGTLPSTCDTYRDEGSYQQLWMPVLALEAADTAVHKQASATVRKISIVWNRQSLADTGKDNLSSGITGHFSLSQSFCKERQLFVSWGRQGRDDLAAFGLEESVPVPSDLMCVRYDGLDNPVDPNLDDRVSAVMKIGSSGKWVGHCIVQQVICNNQGMITVHLRLQSSTAAAPSWLFEASAASQRVCTVEWIPKSRLYRQVECGVACLKSASSLARDVAVGRRPVSNIDQSDVGYLMGKLTGQLNADQKEAVRVALSQPFTVIQGPAGSGKTLTAAHLAGLLAKRNHLMARLPPNPDLMHPQVLICASSDAALDVIAGCLQSMGPTAPRIIRVYDEEAENTDFPVPFSSLSPSKQKEANASNPVLQRIALHHVIRFETNVYHQKIREYDSLFSLYPHDISFDQVESYRSLVYQAELQELQQAQIIMATCSAAASPRLAYGTNIKQIILDSCESCTEPESLLPAIVMRSAQQLVLLGDPRQLQPAVSNSTASSLGLSRSLLERYSAQAVPLTKQYRMPQGISEVPSQIFYRGQLKPCEQSPRSASEPTVFCHVVGQEDTVAATGGAVVQSVCNVKEADAVACFVDKLVVKGVAQSRVVVLTQYAAHVNLIQQHLAQRRLSAVAVMTVVQCQGHEFDFVVLSTCRSLPSYKVEKRPSRDWIERHLGVTADGHQINVALTRAREGMIIIGNKYLLQCCATWRDLIDLYRGRKALVIESEIVNV